MEKVPILLKIRGGVEVDSYGKKAGKGPLLSENLSMTLGVSQDQYLFQPVGVDVYNLSLTGNKGRCLSTSGGGLNEHIPVIIDPVGGQAERAWETEIAPTLKATHYKFPPTVMTFEPGVMARCGGHVYEDVSGTIRAKPGDNQMTVAYDIGEARRRNPQEYKEISPALMAACGTGGNNVPAVVYDARGNGDGKVTATQGGAEIAENLCPTITAAAGMSGNNQPVICLQGNGIDRADTAGCNGKGWREDVCYTLNTIDRPAVVAILRLDNGSVDPLVRGDKSPTIRRGNGPGGTGHVAVCYGISSMGSNAMLSDNPRSGIYEARTSRTLDLNGGNPACNQGGIIVCQYWDGSQTAGTLTANNAGGAQRMPDKDNFNCVIQRYPKSIHDFVAENNSDAPHQQDLLQTADGVARTLAASTHGAAPHLTKTVIKMDNQYIVRRLTPTECCRLQGFPDGWGEIDPKEDFTDEEYLFWLEVRNTHAVINGRKVQNYTKEQMLKWYNKLHTDSAEYKMWGNGIALPNALYVMEGIAEELEVSE